MQHLFREISPRSFLGGLLSFIPGLYMFWDRLRPMGERRPPEYGRNVYRARLEDLSRAGVAMVPKIVMELGPGRSLSGPIAALLDGAEEAYGMDAVAYASKLENLHVFDILAETSSIDKERQETIRAAVSNAGNPAKETVLHYRAPWEDVMAAPQNSVDFIFSVSVLEHVMNSDALYRSCYRWLRPGGAMTHKIDHSSHGITRHWNGHYWIPDRLWRLILGGRPYAINRWTPDDHVAAAKVAGFELLMLKRSEAPDDGAPLYRSQPAGRYGKLQTTELFTRTSTLILRKPEE